ncbi:hypothetical protein [Niastella sp. OAS944]|uniref:hypothetical protein n=1 Tax=Niastella sp. OAS944 TaxID=2664089 RepID=UPI0034973493|nr:hypothetical protein [Chitinophagaceae bacterium OAS944]
MLHGSTLAEQIETLVNNEDLGGLQQLVQSMDAEDLHTHKTQLIEGCQQVFYSWYQDVELEKINKEHEDAVISDLFAILLCIEKIDAENSQHDLRTWLYEHLAQSKTAPEIRLQNIQLAINEYKTALQKETSAEMQARLGSALLKRMQITQQFTEDQFMAAFQLFTSAFATWCEPVFNVFLHSSFKVLNYPCKDNHHWHLQFMRQLEESLTAFAQTDPIIYLTWSNELSRALQYNQYALSTAYAEELSKKSTELLEHVKDYTTTDTERLNQLGTAFEGAAKQMPADATTEKLRYFETAEKYYLQGHSINPAAWTFTVYATNAQMAMARIYRRTNDQAKVIALFEAGKMAFATTSVYDQGFTLMSYWGDFLVDYARVAYNFNAPEILQEAESKLLAAKEKGQGFYSRPFLSLAKVALKLGDKQKCLAILQECKKTFTTEYYEYDFSDVLKDEEFRAVWLEVLPVPEHLQVELDKVDWKNIQTAWGRGEELPSAIYGLLLDDAKLGSECEKFIWWEMAYHGQLYEATYATATLFARMLPFYKYTPAVEKRLLGLLYKIMIQTGLRNKGYSEMIATMEFLIPQLFQWAGGADLETARKAQHILIHVGKDLPETETFLQREWQNTTHPDVRRGYALYCLGWLYYLAEDDEKINAQFIPAFHTETNTLLRVILAIFLIKISEDNAEDSWVTEIINTLVNKDAALLDLDSMQALIGEDGSPEFLVNFLQNTDPAAMARHIRTVIMAMPTHDHSYQETLLLAIRLVMFADTYIDYKKVRTEGSRNTLLALAELGEKDPDFLKRHSKLLLELDVPPNAQQIRELAAN